MRRLYGPARSFLICAIAAAGIFLTLACNKTVDMEPMKIEDSALREDGSYALTINITGAVEGNPAQSETDIELYVRPAPEYKFIEWKGDLFSTENPVKIKIGGSKMITAVFERMENIRDKLAIMPLGNSMTNDPRSRVRLWNLLTGDGYPLDYLGDQYQESSIPDPDHEGVGGINIQGIIDKAESLMNTHNPSYINLMAGTNDIAWHFDETPRQIGDRWNRLVQLLLDHSGPDTWLIAATIPPVTSENVGSPEMEERDRAVTVEHYNSELRAHVQERQANGDNIVLADMEKALTREEHLASDGVHLTEKGYEIMGTKYYEAIISILE